MKVPQGQRVKHTHIPGCECYTCSSVRAVQRGEDPYTKIYHIEWITNAGIAGDEPQATDSITAMYNFSMKVSEIRKQGGYVWLYEDGILIHTWRGCSKCRD